MLRKARFGLQLPRAQRDEISVPSPGLLGSARGFQRGFVHGWHRQHPSHRRPDSGRRAGPKRRRSGVLRTGRELPRAPRRALRFAGAGDGMPARRRSGDGSRGLGQAVRAAGHRHGDPRPGGGERDGRPPHRPPGLDANDPPPRPGGAQVAGPRGFPGGEFQDLPLRSGQVGRRDRRCRPHPRIRVPRLPRGDLGPSRPGGAVAARGHAPRQRRRRRRRPLGAGRDLARPHPDGPAPEAAVGGIRTAACPRRFALECGRRPGRPPLRRTLRVAGCVLLPAPDAVRSRPSKLRGRLGNRPESGPRRAHPRRRSSHPSRRPPQRDAVRRATAISTSPSRARLLSMSIPAPRNSAGSIGRRWPSTPAPPPSPRRSRASSRPTPSPGRRRPGPPTPPTAPGRHR